MAQLYIKMTQYGRGVFCKTKLKKGEMVSLCEILELSPEDTIKINDTGLKSYTFKLDNNRECLVLGHGELFNHSFEYNVSYNVVQYADRYMMEFRAVEDIPANTELLIDYTKDSPEINLSIYGIEHFSNGMKIVRESNE